MEPIKMLLLLSLWLLAGAFKATASTQQQFHKVDFCHRTSILLCWGKNERIAIVTPNCPEDYDDSLCTLYKNAAVNSTKICNHKTQCRLSRSDTLKKQCEKRFQLEITYLCKVESELETVAEAFNYYRRKHRNNDQHETKSKSNQNKSIDLFTNYTEKPSKPTKPTKIRTITKTNQNTPITAQETSRMLSTYYLSKFSKPNIIATTAVTDAMELSTESIVVDSNNETASVKTEKVYIHSTATSSTKEIRRTVKEIKIVEIGKKDSTLLAKETVEVTTTRVSIINPNMTTTKPLTKLNPVQTSTLQMTTKKDQSVVAVEKELSLNRNKPNGIDLYQNISTSKSTEKLASSTEPQPTNSTTRAIPKVDSYCQNEDKSIKADDNYPMLDQDQCYIQCVRGKANWQCCDIETYIYYDECKICLDLQKFSGNCSDYQEVSPTTKTSISISTFFSTPVVFTVDEVTRNLLALQERSISKANAKEVSTNLVEISSNVKDVDSTEKIQMITEIIDHVLDVANSTSEQVSENLVNVVDNLLALESNIISPILSSKIIRQINAIGDAMPVLGDQKPIILSEKNIGFAATKVSRRDAIFSILTDETMQTSIGKLVGKDNAQSIHIPYSALKMYDATTQIYFYALRTNDFFKGSKEDNIRSNILSAAVSKEDINGLHDPVEITFNKIGDLSEKVLCVYWKILNESNGVWSTEGCATEKPFSNQVVCKCTHLTNFALLLDPEQKHSSSKSLKIFSFIGCLVSIFGLGLTLITFMCFKKLREKLPSKILICLCLSLILLMTVFVGGVNQTSSAHICHIVAGLIHYFTLTSFSWMLVEALNLYRTIVKVFTRGNDGLFFKVVSVYAWGSPAIVVGITGYLNRDHFHENHEHSGLCLVSGLTFYYALILPVCMIMIINCVIFIPVMKGILSGEKLIKDSIQQRQKTHARRAKCSLMVVVIIGLSWIFGVLAVGDLREVFQWIFCMFTSFQGLFIFAIFVVFNKETRKVWGRTCGIMPRKSRNSKSYSSSVRMLKDSTNEPSIVINGEAYRNNDQKLINNTEMDHDNTYSDSDYE